MGNVEASPEEAAVQSTFEIPYLLIWNALLRERGFVLKSAIAVAIVAAIIAFLIPNRYQSTAQLMPPEQQAISTTSALNVLTGQLPSVGGGSLLNARTPGATSVGILSSRTVLDEIVNRFDLRRVYGKRLYAEARIRLAARTHIEEDRKNGIIKIEVTDADRNRAQNIARAYIQDLNTLLSSVSTSSARKEREFLEGRIADVKQSLDDSTQALSAFSSRNAMLDVQKQGAATLELAGKLQAELVGAESELSGLRAVYTADNVQVRTASARVAELRGQLQKVSGQGGNADSFDLKSSDMFPSVRKLPILGTTYYDLSRQVNIKETLYATLEKQYELARVQEAKEIPAVKILDEPDIAEKKSFPPRGLIIALSMLLAFFLACLWVIVDALRRKTPVPYHRAPRGAINMDLDSRASQTLVE